MEELFDLSAEYESMLNRGIRLSGEGMLFFLEGRLQLVRKLVGNAAAIGSVLDFGCGLGFAVRRLTELFPDAHAVGCDTALRALASARENNGNERSDYLPLDRLRADPRTYDLCYVNGVFHHIPPADRAEAIALIAGKLKPGGHLFLFENNPWNPGARMVMARIPFDRDAVMLSIPETGALCRKAGLRVESVESLFFFPRPLSILRPLEPALSFTRLGAQYLVWSRKS